MPISTNALPKGSQLETYQIQSVLNQGELSITYLANETDGNTQVVIKEYFPNRIAIRQEDYTLQSEKTDDFTSGLEEFIKNARILTQLEHPNIVRYQRFLKANSTAYVVMDYEEGQNLAELFKADETATEEEIMAILPSLLAGLETIHKADYLHRNIKPENITLRDKDKSPVLLGLTLTNSDKDNHRIASTITPGYAPFEEYQSKGHLGTWTDIYALGAVLYRLISGKAPIEASERIDAIVYEQPDPLPSAIEIAGSHYSEEFLDAIDWALEIRETDRPQTVTELAKVIISEESAPSKKFAFPFPFKRAGLLIIAIVVMVIVMGLGIGYLLTDKAQPKKLSESTPTIPKEAEKKQVAQLSPQTIEEVKAPETQPTQLEERQTMPFLTELPLEKPQIEQQIEKPQIEQQIEKPQIEKPQIEKPQVQQLTASQKQEQPIIQPEQFIRDYYAGISNQQYEKTWLMLSRHFKDQHHCCNEDGSYKQSDYFKWWKTIKAVEVLKMTVLEQSDNTATIKATLRYFKRRGRIVDENKTFNLIKNDKNQWVIK
ncbi:MAG: protein kinase [Thiomargarita sp.]|nr:protein kinase [Thiomargarita sp.]